MSTPTIVDNKVEVRVCFDTTGSMSPCIMQVRRVAREMLTRLAKDVPGIRMGITAHGDYCDDPASASGYYSRGSYVTKHSAMTSDINSIVSFIDNVGNTGGGDSDECYELVLKEVQDPAMGWTPGYKHILVMIGDAEPHEPGYRYGGKTYDINWRHEAKKLADQGVKIYSVQAMSYSRSRNFWSEIAKIGGGHHITLDQFAYITDMLLAICYQQQGPEALSKFETELRTAGRLGRNMATAIGTLAGRSVEAIKEATTKTFGDPGKLRACDPSRFQALEIDADVRIDQFVEGNGIPFIKGRGFYEFMKREEIQSYKEVILMDKASGDLFEGDVAREMLGLPKDKTVKLSPKEVDLGKYTAYIQSTSYNRKLIGGTKFLYEVDRTR
jgi:hypothetical protein